MLREFDWGKTSRIHTGQRPMLPEFNWGKTFEALRYGISRSTVAAAIMAGELRTAGLAKTAMRRRGPLPLHAAENCHKQNRTGDH